MFSCICGGLELFLLVPFVGWLIHLFKRKCCKKSCECKCHPENATENHYEGDPVLDAMRLRIFEHSEKVRKVEEQLKK